MKIKWKPVLISAFALSAANFVIQRYNNKDGYESDPTRSEICATTISISKDNLGSQYNDKAHLRYALTATFQGVLKGSTIDEAWSKDFWNLVRYLKKEGVDDHADLMKVAPLAAQRCMSDYKSNNRSNRQLLGLDP